MREVTDDAPAYLRFPHLHGDLLTFAAEDDLWVAPLAPADGEPTRAWRLTVDRTRIGHPRFSPDGTRIAFTTWRSLDPEIHLAPVSGGPARRLTYWGSLDTRVCGWAPPDADGHSDVLAVASHGQPFSHHTWAYRLGTDGDPGQQLPWGPVAHIAVAEQDGTRLTLLLTGTPPHEPAAWKRYRGGATGRMWLQGERLLPEIDGHLDCPMFLACEDGPRVAFLSDHEGVGNLYSCRTDGADLRRHTDHADFYARHAATDGRRVVYQCAGDLWLVEDFSPDRRAAPAGRAAGRPARRAAHVPGARRGAPGLPGRRPHGPGERGVRARQPVLAHPPGRPGPHHRRYPGCAGAAAAILGDTGQVAYVTDADGRGRAGDRRPATRDARRARRAGSRAGCWAGCGSRRRRRTARRWRSRRTTGGCCWWTCARRSAGRTAAGWAARRSARRASPSTRPPGPRLRTQVPGGRRRRPGHRADPLGQRPGPRPGVLPGLRAGWPGRTPASAAHCARSRSPGCARTEACST